MGNLGNALQISQQRTAEKEDADSGSTFARKKCVCARMRSRVASAKLEQMVNFAEGQKATTLMREIFAIESSRGEKKKRRKADLKAMGKW